MHFTVCYYHSDFVIINKPAGISVHKDEQAVGLTEQIAKQLGVERVWLVHRLDKVTSGLLILALNKEAAAYFYQLFVNHQIQKTYWALSMKKPKKKQGRVVGDMQKSRNGGWKLCHTKESPAVTLFQSFSLEPNLRHFVLQPKTGKTHQLRVTMKSLGSPIIGDELYSGEKSDRIYLHAYQLIFEYKQKTFIINAPPEEGHLWNKINF